MTQQTDQHTRLLHVVGDPNGAPRELLDGEGEVVWAGQLDTWGHLVRCEVRDRNAGRVRYLPGYQPAANDPEIDVELRFANQWADEESGLHYNLNRHYAPELGQYASQDPLGPAGGLRTHGYVHNPLTWVDPLGLSGCPPTFPSTHDEFTRILGVEPTKVGTTPDGTPRAVWEPNENTRIRYESHPEGLAPGDAGFNPRHHGIHYHVETKPSGMSWNQASKKGLVVKSKPDGYTPGSGTGFLPGEKFPGS